MLFTIMSADNGVQGGLRPRLEVVVVGLQRRDAMAPAKLGVSVQKVELKLDAAFLLFREAEKVEEN